MSYHVYVQTFGPLNAKAAKLMLMVFQHSMFTVMNSKSCLVINNLKGLTVFNTGLFRFWTKING